ncbi:MAG: hypothetical protein Q4F75_04370, partial [Pseudomonadota bacterium]|nr:hypothetical protein [Pseudomonadota bacterium]
QCVATTDCASLGYTQTSCPDGKGLKCPFGNTWACTEDKTTNIPPLSIGDILYADKTTSPDVVSGKTPIGIVIDSKNRLAAALEIAPNDLAWQTDNSNSNSDWACNKDVIVDIPSLPNCTDSQYSNSANITCETDGKKNTATIISFAKEKNLIFPAAEYCNNYVPNGCKEAWCGRGQWFLPSMKQFNEFLENLSIHFYRIKTLKKISNLREFLLNYRNVWTSNEYGLYNGKENIYAYNCGITIFNDYTVSIVCTIGGNVVPKCNRRKVLPFIKF